MGIPPPARPSSGIKCGVDVVSYTTINITYREESKVRQTIGNDVQLHFSFKVIVVGRLPQQICLLVEQMEP